MKLGGVLVLQLLEAHLGVFSWEAVVQRIYVDRRRNNTSKGDVDKQSFHDLTPNSQIMFHVKLLPHRFGVCETFLMCLAPRNETPSQLFSNSSF